jgi:phage tail-like protein
MPSPRDLPLGSFNFRVGFDDAGADAGFCAVEFPPFVALGAAAAKKAAATGDAAAPAHLVLRRGFPGTLELYEWWDRTRRSKRAPARTVIVELLDGQTREPVVRWRFTGCRPALLHYSTLDAQVSAVLTETLELSYESVEMT